MNSFFFATGRKYKNKRIIRDKDQSTTSHGRMMNASQVIEWTANSQKNRRNDSDRDRRERQLEVLMAWVSERLSSLADVPRVDDVVHYAYTVLGFRDLKRTDIAKRLRLHPAYLMTSSQTRGKSRWKRYRPITVNTLGMLHGDLGFFSVKREYETPKTFRAGFLVLKDILSRYVYVVILKKSKSAEAMVDAFQTVLNQHNAAFGPDGHRIKSISFDQETSVMSKKVQEFLREQNIAFHAFKFSASKSKMAEGTIKQIRTIMARLIQQHPEKRWWRLLDKVVEILNNQPLRINGKRLAWRPRDVNRQTLRQFRRDVLKADPSQFFSQFTVSPRLVQFKFPIGSWVRPKLLITSSAVVGIKRSEISLESDLFVITEQLAYVNAKLGLGRAYRCRHRITQVEEIFDEEDLALSLPSTVDAKDTDAVDSTQP